MEIVIRFPQATLEEADVLLEIATDQRPRHHQAVALGGEHLDKLAPPGEQRVERVSRLVGQGPGAGRTCSAKRARIWASSASVFANCPVARAKSRTWRGLATTTGSPPVARAATTAAS